MRSMFLFVDQPGTLDLPIWVQIYGPKILKLAKRKIINLDDSIQIQRLGLTDTVSCFFTTSNMSLTMVNDAEITMFYSHIYFHI